MKTFMFQCVENPWHLPYKQRVGGSNPSAPTTKNEALTVSVGAFVLVPILCTDFPTEHYIALGGTPKRFLKLLENPARDANPTV